MPYRNVRDAVVFRLTQQLEDKGRELVQSEELRTSQAAEISALQGRLKRKLRANLKSMPRRFRMTLGLALGLMMGHATFSSSPLHPAPQDVAAGGGPNEPWVRSDPDHSMDCSLLAPEMRSALEASFGVPLMCAEIDILWPRNDRERLWPFSTALSPNSRARTPPTPATRSDLGST